MKTVLTVIAVCALLGSVLVGWKRSPPSPPPIYQRFKFEYWCWAAENTEFTIRIVQYTTEYYTRHVPSGVTLNVRAPNESDINILPPTAVAQQFMRQNNLWAYYFEAKKKNGQVCWTKWLTQVELDELNAEWARMNPRDPDRVAVIRVGEACCR